VSSTYKNSLDAEPSPQTITSLRLFSFASMNFLIKAGTTCDVSKLKLSRGPYKLAGNSTVELKSN
jgi:hypothetical protein